MYQILVLCIEISFCVSKYGFVHQNFVLCIGIKFCVSKFSFVYRLLCFALVGHRIFQLFGQKKHIVFQPYHEF